MNVETLLAKSPEWHERRRQSIGGSDANTIMHGAEERLYELWEEKRGLRDAPSLDDILPVQMGTWTEPLNLYWFQRKTGLAVSREGESALSPDHPFMACTLDGWIASEHAVVQCKHCSGREPFEVILERYTPQVQHEMIVTGAAKAYLSVFLGSGDWRCETIPADPFYAAALIEAERAFWDCVKTGKPPCPPPPVPVPAGEASRIVDMAMSNSWAEFAGIWLETKEHATRFDNAQKELKTLVESDVKRAFGHGVEINRDRRGALRFKECRT